MRKEHPDPEVQRLINICRFYGCPYYRLQDVIEWISSKIKASSPPPKNIARWFDSTAEIERILPSKEN